jgi:protein O-GlcNAc transferase
MVEKNCLQLIRVYAMFSAASSFPSTEPSANALSLSESCSESRSEPSLGALLLLSGKESFFCTYFDASTRSSVQQGQYAQALENLEANLRNTSPEDEASLPQWMALAALLLGYSQQTTQAITLLEPLWSQFPKHTPLVLLLAEAYQQNHEPQKALATYQHHLEKVPQAYAAWQSLAQLLQQGGFAEEAAEALQRSVDCEHGPVSLEVLSQAVNALLAVQQPEAALALFQRALPTLHGETLAVGLFLQGLAYEQSGQKDQADAVYQEALETTQNPRQLHTLMANTFEQQDQLLKALQHWIEVIALTPADGLAYEESARLLLALRRPQEALALTEQAKLKQLMSANLLSYRAQAQGDLGLAQEALQTYETLESHPESAQVGTPAGLAFRKALSLPIVFDSAHQQQQAFERSSMALRALSTLNLSLEDPIAEIGATPYYLALYPQPLKEILTRFGSTVQRALPKAPEATSQKTSLKKLGVFSRFLAQPDHWIAQGFLPLLQVLAKTLADQHPDTELWLYGVEAALQTPPAAWPSDLPWRVKTLSRDWGTLQSQLRNESLDTLCFTDVGLEPYSTYLAQTRLAPKQLAWWASGMSSGATCLEGLVLPEAFLSETTLAYTLSEAALPLKGLGMALPALGEVKASLFLEDFGLTYGQKLLVFHDSPERWGPDFDAFVFALLARFPDVVLQVSEGPFPLWRQKTEARLQAACPADQAHHLKRLQWVQPMTPTATRRWVQLASAVLQAPLGGKSALTLEALRLGTPVLAPKHLPPSRFGFSGQWVEEQTQVKGLAYTSPDDFLNSVQLCLSHEGPLWNLTAFEQHLNDSAQETARSLEAIFLKTLAVE